MEEHYVPYSQAVKLKEFGFDWKVGHEYINVIKDSAREEWDDGECQMCTVYDIERYPKPRLDQAAAWLREVKGIAINVIAHDGGMYHWELIFLPNAVETQDFALLHLSEYDTYETTLSEAIDKVLELLEKGG